jgi:hypothetical protein
MEKQYNYDLCYFIDNANDVATSLGSVASTLSTKNVTNLVEKAAKKTQHFFKTPGVQKALKVAGITLGILTIPVAIKYIYDAAVEMMDAYTKKEHEFVFDNGIEVVQGAVYLAGAPIGIAAALGSKFAIRCLPGFNIATSVISGLGIVKYFVNSGQAVYEKYSASQLISKHSIDVEYKETKAYLESITDKEVMKYYWADKDYLITMMEDLQNAPDAKKEKLLKLINKVQNAAICSQFLYTASSALWLASGLSLVVPTAQAASPFLFLAAAVSSLASDAFSWYQWRSFSNDVEKLSVA